MVAYGNFLLFLTIGGLATNSKDIRNEAPEKLN